MLRKPVLVTLIAVAAVAVAVVVTAATAGSSPRTQTFRLIEKSQDFHFTDTPPLSSSPDQPPSAGDSFVFVSKLETQSGQRAGTLRAQCTVVEGGENGTLTCYGSFGLAAGQLMGMATVRGDQNVTHIAIVGGTGAYVGARGTLTSVSKNDTVSIDTVTLLH